MSDLQILDDSPFAAFVMSEFHEPEVAAIVDREESRALPGQVRCPEPHGRGGTFPHEYEMTPAFAGACPGCGAAV